MMGKKQMSPYLINHILFEQTNDLRNDRKMTWVQVYTEALKTWRDVQEGKLKIVPVKAVKAAPPAKSPKDGGEPAPSPVSTPDFC